MNKSNEFQNISAFVTNTNEETFFQDQNFGRNIYIVMYSADLLYLLPQSGVLSVQKGSHVISLI